MVRLVVKSLLDEGGTSLGSERVRQGSGRHIAPWRGGLMPLSQ